METRLFFNRFPLETAEKDIRKLFSSYGKVSKVTLFTHRETGEPLGRGYVTLDSRESAQAATEALNDMEIEGQLVRVKFDNRPLEKLINSSHPLQKDANEIARLLGETEYQPILTIRNIIAIKGLDFVHEAVVETFRIEEQGGVMLPDGSRRRTPGGVFFSLVKKKLERQELIRLFPQYRAPKPAQKGEA